MGRSGPGEGRGHHEQRGRQVDGGGGGHQVTGKHRVVRRATLIQFCLFVCLFEFRSFRSMKTIVGPGGVIGPLPRPNQGGGAKNKKCTQKKTAKRPRVLLI